jgi:uncharacterized damage-inducible protein DinB
MQTDSSLLLAALRTMYLRDLKATDAEIAAYADEASLWVAAPGISNAGGTLAIHIAGNMRHFVGAVLGKTGYIRDRDAEFAGRNVPRENIRADLAAAIDEVMRTLDRLTDADLAREFPILIGQEKLHVRTSDWLVHLAAHLAYHLGQIDYHRRLLSANPVSTDNVSLRELAIRE